MSTSFICLCICALISMIFHAGAVKPCHESSNVDGDACGDFQCCATRTWCEQEACALGVCWIGGIIWKCRDQTNPTGDMPACTPLCDGISSTAVCTQTSTLADNYNGCQHPGQLISNSCDCGAEFKESASNCAGASDWQCTTFECSCTVTCEWTNLFCPIIYDGTAANGALVPVSVTGGDAFIQINEFRLGLFDLEHFSVSSQTAKKTIIYFNKNGIATAGPSDDYGLWNKPLLGTSKNIRFTSNGIEFAAVDSNGINQYNWCLGLFNEDHFILASKIASAIIYTTDGVARYMYTTPRTDHSCWNSGFVNDVKITLNRGKYNLIFNNAFSIIYSGASHLSVVGQKTCEIFRAYDGTLHTGPLTSWNGGFSPSYCQESTCTTIGGSIPDLFELKINKYNFCIIIGVIILFLVNIVICFTKRNGTKWTIHS